MTYDLKYEIETFPDDKLIIRVYRNNTLVGTFTNPYITSIFGMIRVYNSGLRSITPSTKFDGRIINDYLIRKIYNTRSYIIKGGR